MGMVVVPSASAAAVTATLGGMIFTANTSDVAAGATIEFANTPAVDLTIPATVTLGGVEFAVTSVDANAFRYSSLDSVYIPDSVTTIAEYAFADTGLAAVRLPENLDAIGAYAFSTNSIEDLIIPASVASIGASAFAGNTLGELIIPNTVTSIGAGAFQHAGLTSVQLPNALTVIDDYAFDGNALTAVDIPATVTAIGASAFSQNPMTTVTIPDQVASIGESAFAWSGLTSVVLGESVGTIGDWAFANAQLATVTIPDSVESIGFQAFDSNELTTVIIGSSVNNIGGGAFRYNDNLASVQFRGDEPAVLGTIILGWSDEVDPLVSYYGRYAPSFGDSSGLWDTTTSSSYDTYRTQALAAVTFDSQGIGTAPAPADVVVGESVAEPSAPSATGFTFDGWFDAAAAGSPVNFSSAIASDTTVYAQWTEAAVVVPPVVDPPVVEPPVTEPPVTEAPGAPEPAADVADAAAGTDPDQDLDLDLDTVTGALAATGFAGGSSLAIAGILLLLGCAALTASGFHKRRI